MLTTVAKPSMCGMLEFNASPKSNVFIWLNLKGCAVAGLKVYFVQLCHYVYFYRPIPDMFFATDMTDYSLRQHQLQKVIIFQQ